MLVEVFIRRFSVIRLGHRSKQLLNDLKIYQASKVSNYISFK